MFEKIVFRWIRAICWGVLGYYFTMLVDTVDILNKFTSIFPAEFSLFWDSNWLVLLIPALLFLMVRDRFRFARISHLSYLVKFPASWFFFFLGILIYLLTLLPYNLLLKVGYLCCLFLIIFFDWDGFLAFFRPSQEYLQVKGESLKRSLDNKYRQPDRALLNKVKKWASRQSDEVNLNEDLIGLEDRANEIFGLIKKDYQEKSCSIVGVVGPFGSGKSSMLKFIRDKIKTDKKFLMVSVSVWEFESTHSIERYILKKIAVEINKHIYAPHLSNITFLWQERTNEAIKSSQYFSFISLLNDHSLDEIMLELSEALKACNKHLVLIMEDIDRRVDLNFDLGSLQRLLEILKKDAKNVSVIVAGDISLHNGKNGSFDLLRLLDNKKEVPFLEIATVRNLLSVITYTLYDNQKGNEQFPPIWEDNAQGGLNYVSTNDIKKIIKTPRKLKEFTFRLIERWDWVKEGINFYDFFIIVFLKINFPNTANFLDDNFDILIKLEQNVLIDSPLESEFINKLPEKWKEIYSKYTLEEQDIVRIFVATLFLQSYKKNFGDELSKVKDKSSGANLLPNMVSSGFYDYVDEKKKIIISDNWERFFKNI